jgi:hypothetical protein
MTKTIEMVIRVEVSEPVGVTVDNDTVRSLAAESVIKVRAVEWALARRGYATVRASVQAYGAVKTVTNQR